MILLFNTYVTDTPLNHIHGGGSVWDNIRNTDTSYKRKSKIDIFKYTIESYRHIDFEHQFFFYELEDTSRYEEINSYIKSIFPNAFIHNRRACYQIQYSQLIEFIKKYSLKDEWIFYSPNNDHPFTSTKPVNFKIFFDFLKKYEKENIGIFYSHHEEFVHLPYKGNWFSDMYNNASEPREIVEEDDNAVLMRSALGENTGIQIVNFNLFEYWFLKNNLEGIKLIRPEDTRHLFYVHDQLSLIPKFEVCSHYDGQPTINPSEKPPLFIPEHFFDNKIKIKLNDDVYHDGYVNINKNKKYYSFENKEEGTDLKLDIENLPLFWKDKIEIV